MGGAGDLLQRVLRTSGRPFDQRAYQKGVVTYEAVAGDDHSESDSDGSDKNVRNKRRKVSVVGGAPGTTIGVERPLRVAIDVSELIVRAEYGHGSKRVDERHLSNYGRAQLQKETQAGIDPTIGNQPSVVRAEANNFKYVRACANYVVRELVNFQENTAMDILVVFDGRTPPLKVKEVKTRHNKRKASEQQRDTTEAQENKKRLQAAKRAGAGQYHYRVVSEIMASLRQKKIPFLVAPYEADGQLAYLAQRGLVDIVKTEDSDLVSFGIDSLLYRKGTMLLRRCDYGAMELQSKSLSLSEFTTEMLAVMLVAMGCDYCDSLPGIGSVSARNAVRDGFAETQLSCNQLSSPLQKTLDNLFGIAYQRDKVLDPGFREEYERNFLSALFVLRHPIVFCPLRGECVVLNDPPQDYDQQLLRFQPYADMCQDAAQQKAICGDFPPDELQVMHAEGWLNPRTLEPFDHVQLPSHEMRLWETYRARVDLEDQMGAFQSVSQELGITANRNTNNTDGNTSHVKDGGKVAAEGKRDEQENDDSNDDRSVGTDGLDDDPNDPPVPPSKTQAGESVRETTQPASQDSAESYVVPTSSSGSAPTPTTDTQVGSIKSPPPTPLSSQEDRKSPSASPDSEVTKKFASPTSINSQGVTQYTPLSALPQQSQLSEESQQEPLVSLPPGLHRPDLPDRSVKVHYTSSRAAVAAAVSSSAGRRFHNPPFIAISTQSSSGSSSRGVTQTSQRSDSTFQSQSVLSPNVLSSSQ